MKVPQISFWKTIITPGYADPKQVVYACHAVRCWDVPSNGVFMLCTHDELFCRNWSDRVDWRGILAERLAKRERRLFAEYGRHWKMFLLEYSDEEIWCPI